jgi:ectoine hydroxylase-related dioxygenase (phytanoyl-CoA dioxygenase family)
MEDVDVDNGSLSYLPASHVKGIRPHHASRIKGFSQSLSEPLSLEEEASLVEIADLKAGDMVAHHSECIHIARENTCPSGEAARSALGHASKGRTRWAFASVFNGAGCTLDEAGMRR